MKIRLLLLFATAFFFMCPAAYCQALNDKTLMTVAGKDISAGESSDDPSVEINGGNLGYFPVFQMISPFVDAAYALNRGDISMPVRTPYGWHIIKLLDRKAHGTYEEMLPFLGSRINPGHINSLSRKAFVSNLKKEYDFILDTAVCKWFLDNTDTLVIRGLSKYNRREVPSGNLFTFAGRQFSTDEFASFIEKGETGPDCSDTMKNINTTYRVNEKWK